MTDSEKEVIRTLIRQMLKLEISVSALREIVLASGIVTENDFQQVANAVEFDQDGRAHQMLLDLLETPGGPVN